MFIFSHIQVTQEMHHAQEFITSLLEKSFPQEERRDTKEFWDIVFSSPIVQCYIVEQKSIPIAFYYIWNFTDFVYIEFIAVAEAYRSKGLFSSFFQEILQLFPKTIICEAERVPTPQAERRLALYKRLGFTILSETYMQPPFRKSDSPQPMYLLAYEQNKETPSTEHIIHTLYTNVYPNIANL